MKPLGASKQRLASVLSPERRAALVLWMLERVVTAASSCGEAVVVGGDGQISARCGALGARWEPDAAPDLNATLQAALEDSPEGMLFLPGDLPLVRGADVEAMIATSAGSRLVLAPGRRGGTNSILVPPGMGFTFQMGGDSFRRHVQAASGTGVVWTAYHSRALEADVDLPEDLEELEKAEPALWGLAGSTAR